MSERFLIFVFFFFFFFLETNQEDRLNNQTDGANNGELENEHRTRLQSRLSTRGLRRLQNSLHDDSTVDDKAQTDDQGDDTNEDTISERNRTTGGVVGSVAQSRAALRSGRLLGGLVDDDQNDPQQVDNGVHSSNDLGQETQSTLLTQVLANDGTGQNDPGNDEEGQRSEVQERGELDQDIVGTTRPTEQHLASGFICARLGEGGRGVLSRARGSHEGEVDHTQERDDAKDPDTVVHQVVADADQADQQGNGPDGRTSVEECEERRLNNLANVEDGAAGTLEVTGLTDNGEVLGAVLNRRDNS